MKNAKPSSSPAWLAFSALLTAGAGAGYALRQRLKRPSPPVNGRYTLPGLQKKVQILRDTWGVPHIYAATERDLFYAQGFVHAQDRLFQMDASRRIGAGRLSELVGPFGLRVDKFARTFGWPRAVQAQIEVQEPYGLGLATAYAEGVNAFIGLKQFPPEYTVLATSPAPWTIEDTGAWGVVLAWALAVNWESELTRALILEHLGPEKTADLTPTYDHSHATILPSADLSSHLAEGLLNACHQAISYLPLGSVPAGAGIGSNNWVVNGRHTTTGRPILANDPHLPPVFPSIWYENHLIGGDFNVTGFTSPGVPGIIMGHNEQVAWGITNAFPDVQDLYLERVHPENPLLYEVNGEWVAVESVSDTIQVRGSKPVSHTVRWTRHGPIVSDLLPGEQPPLAFRWTAYEPNEHLRAMLSICRAHDWQSFREGLRTWAFPSQNVVYADTQGHIGYTMPGIVPIRAKGNGLLPVPGWNSEYEWVGKIPFEELPVIFDPPEGMIATANNQVVGSDYPHWLTGEWLQPYRALRILELLKNGDPHSLEDTMRMQLDTVSIVARRFMPHLRQALAQRPLPAAHQALVPILDTWQYDLSLNSIAATLYKGTFIFFTRAVIEQAVGHSVAEQLLGREIVKDLSGNYFPAPAEELTLRWLEEGAPEWVGDIRPLLLPAFRKTVQTLEKKWGKNPSRWQWGQLHHLTITSPLGRVPLLGRLWKPVTFPVAGDGHCIAQANTAFHFPPPPVNMIASCRMVLDVGEWDQCQAVLPGGQSGHPASPHYLDGLVDWRNGRYHPMLFSRERILAATENELTLEPPEG